MKHPCRYCHKPARLILSLGRIPLVNYFPKPGEETNMRKYPLDFYYCESCGLGQTGVRVPPARIFTTYHYVSGTSAPLVADLKNLAREIKSAYVPHGGSLLDIGCNDGTLLSQFGKTVRVHGVEPAGNIAALARKRGITVTQDYFNEALARKLAKTYGQFDVITLTHALANMPDLGTVLRGIALLLRPGGMLIIDVASLESMLAKGHFDSIYHEHYYYFSKFSLARLISDAGLRVVRMRDLEAQGGTTRVYATTNETSAPPLAVSRIPKKTISDFQKKVTAFRRRFMKAFGRWRGKRIYGFGAPAKAVTFLNVMSVTYRDIRAIVDSTGEKQGRRMPGTMIPIFPERYLQARSVDAVLLLSWNYQKEILSKISRLVSGGTPVIIPFPRLKIQKSL